MKMFGKDVGASRLRERIDLVASRQAASLPVSGPRAEAPVQPPAPVHQAEDGDACDKVMALLQLSVEARIEPGMAARQPRDELILATEQIVARLADQHAVRLTAGQRRDLASAFVDERIGPAKPKDARPEKTNIVALSSRANIENTVPRIYPLVMERIDSEVATRLTRQEFSHQLADVVAEILVELKIQLNRREQRDLIDILLNDMLGLGPLEPLLADDTVNDIMVNGAKQIYVERRGKLELTDATFRDNGHVMSVVTRIVGGIGRRIDESTPLVDARLADGSRVNIIIPPLAIDGPSISIRKFSKKGITLDVMAKQQNISPKMATVLKIASRSRLNILISGGTGSGKTTLLNAM